MALATFTTFSQGSLTGGPEKVPVVLNGGPTRNVLPLSCPCSRKILTTPLLNASERIDNVAFVVTADLTVCLKFANNKYAVSAFHKMTHL